MTQVLLIEDDPHFTSMVERVANSLSLALTTCATAKAGLTRLAQGEIDIAIVDDLLPDKSGMRIVEDIKARPAPHPRIVFLSGLFKDLRSFRKLKSIGVDKVLQKPISAHALHAELNALVKAICPSRQRRAPSEDGLDFAAELDRMRHAYTETLAHTSAIEFEALLERANDGELGILDEIHDFCTRLASVALSYDQSSVADAAAHLGQRIERDNATLPMDEMMQLRALLHAAATTTSGQLSTDDGIANGTNDTDDIADRTYLARRFERVLLLSHLDDVHEQLATQLDALGLRSEQAHSVPEAVGLIFGRNPDLILVDAATDEPEQSMPAAVALALLFPDIPLVALGTPERPLPMHIQRAPMPTNSDTLAQLLAARNLAPFPGMSILVCDDDNTTALVRTLCAPLGISVHAAHDLSDYMAALVERNPALVLMGVNLPLVSGFERCRMTKSAPTAYDTPVIFLSARTGSNDRRTAYRAGAAGYILKPLVGEELMSELSAVLRQRRSAERALSLTQRGAAHAQGDRTDTGDSSENSDERYQLKTLPWFRSAYQH